MGASGENRARNGFTLIELSIVLVIIGLIAGGILVGQSLISAAAARAQISQIEKYNQATNTFYQKYGGLPGDLNGAAAGTFGFAPRGSLPGQGDGNGIIEGYSATGLQSAFGHAEGAGETVVFWEDLSQAGLIEGNFSTASETTGSGSEITGSAISLYLPQAKIANGGYVYVWNTTCGAGSNCGFYQSPYNANYFGVSAVNLIDGTGSLGGLYGKVLSTAIFTPAQANSIDSKVDDGLPLSGNVVAVGLSNDGMYAINSTTLSSPTAAYSTLYVSPASIAAMALPAAANSCMDNNNSGSNPLRYSVASAIGMNCALSFKMQAGD